MESSCNAFSGCGWFGGEAMGTAVHGSFWRSRARRRDGWVCTGSRAEESSPEPPMSLPPAIELGLPCEIVYTLGCGPDDENGAPF